MGVDINEFSKRIIELIHSIPEGSVATYGQIAAMAGNQRAARQVARILHSCSEKEDLPWYRVVNREGRISLKPFQGLEVQKQLLEKEGVSFDTTDRISLTHFQWCPS